MREGGEGGRDEGKMEGGMERRGGGMDGWTMTVNKLLFLSKYPIPVNNNSNIRSRMSFPCCNNHLSTLMLCSLVFCVFFHF